MSLKHAKSVSEIVQKYAKKYPLAERPLIRRLILLECEARGLDINPRTLDRHLAVQDRVLSELGMKWAKAFLESGNSQMACSILRKPWIDPVYLRGRDLGGRQPDKNCMSSEK